LNSASVIPQMTTKKKRSCRKAIAPLPGTERFDDALSDRGEQHHEPPEDEGVEHAGERPPEQPSLGDHVHEEGSHARQRMIAPTLVSRCAPHQAEQLSPAQSAGDQGRRRKQHERDRAEDRGHSRGH
jgi:hypothetical protein